MDVLSRQCYGAGMPHTSDTPEFFQDGPRLGNQYEQDSVLRAYLKRKLPTATLAAIEPDLRALGARAAGDLFELSSDERR